MPCNLLSFSPSFYSQENIYLLRAGISHVVDHEMRKKVIMVDSEGFGLSPGRLELPLTQLRKVIMEQVWRERQRFSLDVLAH